MIFFSAFSMIYAVLYVFMCKCFYKTKEKKKWPQNKILNCKNEKDIYDISKYQMPRKNGGQTIVFCTFHFSMYKRSSWCHTNVSLCDFSKAGLGFVLHSWLCGSSTVETWTWNGSS